MTLNRLFEDFGRVSGAPSGNRNPDASEAVEAARSQGYEAGYSSGWEDALAAEAKQRARIDAEFERCVQDLGFTFHEALTQLRSEAQVLLDAIVGKFLPEVLPLTLREAVREELMRLADQFADPEVVLRASPDTVPVFEQLAADNPVPGFRIRGEPSLGPNQAFLRFENRETSIDLDEALGLISSQIAALKLPDEQEAAHG